MADEILSDCPFCGAGESRIDESNHWTGMSIQLIRATVLHWCNKGRADGAFLKVSGRTREEAIARWNTRTNPNTPMEIE